MAQGNELPPSPLAITQISLSYGSKQILKNINLTLQKGQILALVGPNGSGKSTLLNLVSGVISPTHGKIFKEKNLSVAYVTQQTHNKAWLPLTVEEIVTMGFYKEIKLWKKMNVEQTDFLKKVTKELEIYALFKEQFWNLSGGQKQRVRLAQALVQDPDLLLLDEPLAGLDLANQSILLQLLFRQPKKNRITILTTHNLDVANHCDSIALLANKLIASGSPKETLTPEKIQQTFSKPTFLRTSSLFTI